MPYLTAEVTDGNIVELSWDFYKENGVNITQYSILYRDPLSGDYIFVANKPELVETGEEHGRVLKSFHRVSILFL